MKVGEIRGPVKTSFGYHVIRLDEIKGDQRRASHILIESDSEKKRTMTFDEARERVERDYRRHVIEDRYVEMYETLANLTYEVPETLEDAANALDLEIKTAGPITRTGDGSGLAKRANIVEAAFSEDVLVEGRNSDPLEIGEDHVVVLRVKDHILPKEKPLDTVKAEIEQQLKRDKAIALVKQQGEQIMQRIEQGEQPEALADLAGATLVKPAVLERKSTGMPAGVLQNVFKAPRPTGDKPMLHGAVLNNGDYAIISLYKVEDGTPDADAVKTARAELQKMYGQEYLQMYLRYLREATKVQIPNKPDET
jgi:peptidyl-prolyl cis-trans isomerase D